MANTRAVSPAFSSERNPPMAHYAIGDLQGCCSEFEQLLAAIEFNPHRDQLWLAGDLINRGPRSLDTLERVHQMRGHCQIVLGNHDIHLLAVSVGARKASPGDTLGAILKHRHATELLDWLRHQPLIQHAPERKLLMVHAGLLPQWSLDEILSRARALEHALQDARYADFLQAIFDDSANKDSQLSTLRESLSVFTRLRFCHKNGKPDYRFKGELHQAPRHLKPWFDLAHQRDDTRVVFGHWAALGLKIRQDILALDSGCVWGGALTAVRLDRPEPPVQIQCPCARPVNIALGAKR